MNYINITKKNIAKKTFLLKKLTYETLENASVGAVSLENPTLN